MNKNYKIDKRTPEENKSFYRLLKNSSICN